VALEESVATERGEELLEELNRHPAPFGDLSDRDRAVARARELGHRDDGVPGLRRDRDHPALCTGRDGASEPAEETIALSGRRPDGPEPRR
jgi:hypothetical protein